MHLSEKEVKGIVAVKRTKRKKKNNLKINLKKNALLLISKKFFQNLKKELNSVGTSPMDWFYNEK